VAAEYGIEEISIIIVLFPYDNAEGCDTMAKDSQIDTKEVRGDKAKGGHTMAESALDGEGANDKKQSGNRHKPGADSPARR